MGAGCIEYNFHAVADWTETQCEVADHECTQQLALDQADLVACYGSSEGSPDLPWVATCDGTECVVQVGDIASCPVVDDCGVQDCVSITLDPPQEPDCCNESVSNCLVLTEWTDATDAFIQELEADCGVGAVALSDASICGEGEEVPVVWAEPECAEKGDGLYEGGAAFWLYVDPEQSWVELTTATDTAQTALSGGGSVGSDPASFLSARVWADDQALDGVQYSDWRFLLAGALEMNLQSGQFVVPHDTTPEPRVYGAGYQGASGRGLTLGLPQDATGVMNNQSMTWSLDFYRSGGAQPTVDLHLEGDYEAAP